MLMDVCINDILVTRCCYITIYIHVYIYVYAYNSIAKSSRILRSPGPPSTEAQNAQEGVWHTPFNRL